jgi:hypothetical protein
MSAGVVSLFGEIAQMSSSTESLSVAELGLSPSIEDSLVIDVRRMPG